MSTMWVVLAYGVAAVLALFSVYSFGAKAWFWHVLSVIVALAVGLTPVPVKWNTPLASLVIGCLFIFLFLWGVAAPFLGRRRRPA